MGHKRSNPVLLLGFFVLLAGYFLLAPSAVYAVTVNWTQVNTDGFGSAQNYRSYALINYGGSLYAATANTATGTEIWKYNGTTWTQANTDGFGNALNTDTAALVPFNNKLYAGVWNSVQGCGVWSYDGTTWTQVNIAGFGDTNNDGIYAMQVYNGKLYASTYNNTTGVEVWSYDGTTWTQANTDGFGTAGNIYSDAMTVFNGKLVVGAANLTTGGQLWQYDGTTWTAMNANGFGDVTNKEPFSLLADGSALYAGTWNDTTGTELWKYDGATWVQVGTDGLGDANNSNILHLVKFHYQIFAVTRNLVTGGEVWTYDGTTFAQSGTDGLGDANNLLLYMPTDFNHRVYIGTWNMTTGAEIWKGEIADTVAPTIASFSPAKNATGVARDSNVSFFLDDATWGIDTAALDVTVDGRNAIVDGVFQSGFSGTITSDGDRGYTVTINPAANFLYGRQVAVTMQVADLYANALSDSWTFAVGNPSSLGIVMTPASAGGPNIRVVDEAGHQISSFFAYASNLRMGLQVAQADIDGDGINEIIVTPGAGVESRIKAFERDGTEIASTLAFNAGFRGGVSLATGDFNGDGKADIAVAPISAGGPNIRVYTLNSAGNAFELLDWFFAYQTTFKGGINLAAGDLTGHDGVDELVVTPRGQGGPNLRVYRFNSSTGDFELVDWTLAYQSTYTGGVQVATGDVNGDGNDDIVVSPYLNGGPNVRIYTVNGDGKLEFLTGIMAYTSAYRGTLSMSVGDVDGDGLGEIVLAPKTLGGPDLRIYSYINEKLVLDDSFMVYQSTFRGGVNLFVADVDGDGIAEIIASPASQGGPNIRVYDMSGTTRSLVHWFWAFPQAFRGGVNFGK